MYMAELDLNSMFDHMSRVHAQLSNSSTAQAYANRARADTPIIDEFLDQIGLMMRDKTVRNRKAVLQAMQRDLLILLALREIEHEHERAEARLRAAMN